MSIFAAPVTVVSRPWFFAQTIQLLNVHTVEPIGWNVYFPPLPVTVLLGDRAMRLQHLDAVAQAFPEPPN
jgi:hypothetical protein